VIVGTLSSADSLFHRPGAQVSAHFGIGGPGDPNFTDGALVQWVDTDQVAYAQGAGNWAPTSYVGFEVAGYPADPMTPAQVATLGKAIGWAAGVHGFPLVAVDHGGHGVTTHCHYPSGQADPAWGNHSCPGPGPRLGQMPQVLAAASGTHPVPVPPPVTLPPVEVDVQLTKTLISVQLGLDGKGWTVLDGQEGRALVPFANCFGCDINGSDPTGPGGYVSFLPPTWNDKGGFTQIEVFGGSNAVIGVWVVHTL